MIHFLGITAATAFIILCTLLPFLPGRYDSLAVPLSMMAQIFGKVGLLLVPVGALWMASEYWRRHALDVLQLTPEQLALDRSRAITPFTSFSTRDIPLDVLLVRLRVATLRFTIAIDID